MKAAYTPSYGPADLIEMRDVPTPTVGEHDVLLQVGATAVTEGDRRLRAGDFPGITAVLGRLAMGITGPRNPCQGSMFAGRVVQVGTHVTRFAVGDDVFGETGHSAFAEFLCVNEDSSLSKMPTDSSHAEAASIPYGAGTALHFLDDLAEVEAGEEVLVLGASGGVGRFAVQLAKHRGAEVTAVCSTDTFALVRGLGADHCIDYRKTDFRETGQRYDVVFDIAGASSFSHSRGSLTESGRYLTLYFSIRALLDMAWTSMFSGQRAMVSVSVASSATMEKLRELVEEGVFSACIGPRFPFERIVDAHRAVETAGQPGTVVVTFEDLSI